jgi:tRNA dimethylallyltransferase
MTEDNHSLTKLIVILGPTAVGKSDFAVELALQHKGEVISADSRQVYANTDLLTGTIQTNEMRGVPHHLLSFRDISQPYSVTEFVKDAKKTIDEIVKRGNTPILCGGTAMYIDALIYNQIFPSVPPNESLRAELSLCSISELYEKLVALDPVRASTIDTQNPRRLIRAIEIATALGSVPEITHGEKKYEVLLIGLSLPKEILEQKIHDRITKRMSAGMLEEIQTLQRSGVSYEYLRTFGLEFSSLSDLAEHPENESDILQKLYFDILHYTKRQKLWWKKNNDIVWLAPNEIDTAHDLATKFLQK